MSVTPPLSVVKERAYGKKPSNNPPLEHGGVHPTVFLAEVRKWELAAVWSRAQWKACPTHQGHRYLPRSCGVTRQIQRHALLSLHDFGAPGHPALVSWHRRAIWQTSVGTTGHVVGREILKLGSNI